MKVCTFFGHRDCPESIQDDPKAVLTKLIVEQGVELFYTGNQGQFDAMVRYVLRGLAQDYPHIRYAVVLAYMPGKASEYEDHFDTMFPEGLEKVHPRYAISRRNDWMLQQADFVVTYVTHPWGGAARYAQQAERMGKAVLSLAKLPIS